LQVVVSGSAISDIAMHFLERYQLMVVKVPSKFQLRRVCNACGATGLVRLGAPTAEELGFCDDVSVSEIGGTKVSARMFVIR
jgi:T-complex protein 1 subunit theta